MDYLVFGIVTVRFLLVMSVSIAIAIILGYIFLEIILHHWNKRWK